MEQFGNVLETVEDKVKYFTKITAKDRKKVKSWVAKQKGKGNEEIFLATVKEAVKVINYDYWIANIEPSVIDGKIYYAEGNKVGVNFSSREWNQLAEHYAPERGSRLADIYELFIWYALRIVNGLWTLDYVANNSSSAGNYWDAPGSTHFMERTGVRECGGYRDGQGNSHKIVTCGNDYVLIGGTYSSSGYGYPVADIYYDEDPHRPLGQSSGVLTLTK